MNILLNSFSSERERVKEGVKGKTKSLWSFINSNLDDYLNPLYCHFVQNFVLFPQASLRHIKLWKGYYCRWNPSMRPQVSLFFKGKIVFFVSFMKVPLQSGREVSSLIHSSLFQLNYEIIKLRILVFRGCVGRGQCNVLIFSFGPSHFSVFTFCSCNLCLLYEHMSI